jgi:hypothetical protein
MKSPLIAMVAAIATILATAGGTAANSNSVYVNRVQIGQDQLQILQSVYGPIRPGAYWYDPVSGWWGPEGGPVQGQIDPWLALGGPLRADASGGGTGVFINGRELHPIDVARLQQMFGNVPMGRYWVGADGIGGIEGGPASFNLNGGTRAASPADGVGYGGYIDRGYGGTYGSDGKCFYISVDGGDVMGPGC